MIKDVAARWLFIPLLGMLIPLFSGFIRVGDRSILKVIAYQLFCIAVTFIFWQVVVAITAFIRNRTFLRYKQIFKILLLISCTALFGFTVCTLFTEVLKKLPASDVQYQNSSAYIFAYVAIAPVIGLSYEILFLTKEQELDSKIVKQLDFERQAAEMNVLKAEIDPHFIFNSLTALVPLIATDAYKAHEFTTKLAQVYKYLLVNKDRELITLGDELHFIQDYFFLLQIRHENKLKLKTALDDTKLHQVFMLPFALQLLVENAIKHNQFSVKNPLIITISINEQFIEVSNTARSKHDAVESTNIGLKNLSSRYKLSCNRDIIIHQAKDRFLVKLPLIKTTV